MSTVIALVVTSLYRPILFLTHGESGHLAGGV